MNIISGARALSIISGVVLALSGLCASAAQVTITPANDNTIYQGTDPVTAENYELNSCGVGTNLFSGQTSDDLLRRALLRFDIAGAIPAGSTINSATLTVTVNRSGGNVPQTMTLRPLSQDWGEGTVDCDAGAGGGGRGLPANAGDATWVDAKFQQTSWGTAGGDFGAISASADVGDSNGAEGIWDSSVAGNTAMVVDLQGWLDNPVSNNGWVLVGLEGTNKTTRRFSAREGGNPPSLTIDFTPTGDVFACCFQDGACTVTDTDSCTSQGGTADTNTNSCGPNPCPQPSGACCNQDESCSELARDVCESGGGVFQGEAVACDDNAVDCGLTPFVDALPIPPALAATGTRADGVLQYTVDVVDASQQLHSELPATDVWTYNGAYPSFTIEARSGVPIEVTYNNNLPTNGRRGGHLFEVDECAHGPNIWGNAARISTHLHGGHLPAADDGQPELTILPGQSQVLEYPNNQEPGTLWYHDHALGITRLNVYAGMAGFYLLRDDFEDALGLPAGEFEIPIVIQDREFNPDGSFFYPPTITNAFFGDKILVNGKVWPFLDVKQGKYRFRLLNGSQARQYSLRLENLANPSQVIPFTLIGTDLGLIEAPINLDTIDPMVGAERMDVIVDFSGFPAGTEIVLRNDDLTTPVMSNVMKFNVQGETGFTGPIPAALRPVTPIPEGESVATRRFSLDRINDPGTPCGFEWLVRSLDAGGNEIGRLWDDISEMPQLGTTEIWQFENPSNLMHPMHIHLVKFQVLDRLPLGGGAPIPLDPWEINTWKDTVKVPPNTQVRVIARFEDYPGRFPYHCHILDHEDHEMMRQFRTTNDPANCNNDDTCDYGEDTISCANDCGTVSGAFCGNGICEAGDGENCETCAADCAGKQKGSASKQYCCGADDGNVTNPLICGSNANGSESCVDASNARACRVGTVPLAECGDGLCEGAETGSNCPADCLPPPPPQVCTRNAPGFGLGGNQSIAPDGSAVYTLSISNNDTAACPDTSFDLGILSETGDTGSFSLPSVLSATDVTLAAGASSNAVTLTVSGDNTGADGDLLDSSVEVRDDTAHAGQQQSDTVRTTIAVAPACTRNAPGFSLDGDQSIAPDGSAVYTLSISNNDTAACADTSFDLSILSETGDTGSFSLPSVLSAVQVILAAGASSNTETLTVSGNNTGADGDLLDSSVDVRDDTDHTGQQQSDTARTTITVGAMACSDWPDKNSCRDAGCRWKKNTCQDP